MLTGSVFAQSRAAFISLCFALVMLVATGLARAGAAKDEAISLVARAETMVSEWNGDDESLEAARSLLERAIAMDPEYAEAYRQYARAHLQWSNDRDAKGKKESLDRAESALDRAVQIDPEFGNAHSLRGHLYRLQKRTNEAKAALDTAERLGADDPWLLTNRAELFLDEGQPEEALAACRIAGKQHPDFRRLIKFTERCMIRSLLQLDRLDDAEKIYKAQSAHEDATSYEYSSYARFLLCYRNRADAAMKQANKALRLSDPGQSRLYYLAALYFSWAESQNEGDDDKAGRIWKQLQRVPIDDPAEVMFAACGMDETRFAVLRALRDTHRARLVEPMLGVMATAERAPRAFQATFVMEVRGGAMVQGESYINSEEDYRDPRTLIVRFPPKATAAFIKEHGQTPDQFLTGKTITIVGYAQKRRIDFTADGMPTGKYYFQTQVIVTEPWQVKEFDPNDQEADDSPSEIDV